MIFRTTHCEHSTYYWHKMYQVHNHFIFKRLDIISQKYGEGSRLEYEEFGVRIHVRWHLKPGT